MKITIPLVLPSPNRKLSWWAAHAETRRQKQAVALALFQLDAPPMPCRVVLTRVAPRAYDSDNVRTALKVVRDMTAAWLKPEAVVVSKTLVVNMGNCDRGSDIRWAYRQRKGSDYAVEIEVEGKA